MAETLVLETTFRITGRGLVLATQQWSGGIRVGQYISLPDGKGGKRTERITGVETGRRTDERGEPITWIGILVGDVPEVEIALLQARLHAGDILTIEELKRDT